MVTLVLLMPALVAGPRRSTLTWDEVRSFFPISAGIAIASGATGIGRGNPPVLGLGGLLAAVPVLVAAGAHRRKRWFPVATGRDDDHDRPDGRGAGTGDGRG
ncbi:hypothetical protein [Pseudonocardia humida]|uniref:Uncharacterized protein n=1 Tax=Pseudonocardia humida TaxID=2800819 RepID=A0ABT1A9C0_9PSEU|nr:hypothetical protein [Pseudonocardia humida]MCO1659541.1 hypothetical protein [Pseudonocardia humida]